MKKHLFMAMAAMISMAWMTGCSGGESKETAVDTKAESSGTCLLYTSGPAEIFKGQGDRPLPEVRRGPGKGQGETGSVQLLLFQSRV